VSSESIKVECPSCGERYETQHGTTIDLSRGDEVSEQDLYTVTRKRCPSCGHVVDLSMLLIDEYGVFHLEAR
jgi:uncharacterized Zn finger protein